ncbi:MAG: LysM peptidoglycan-binding domain-containing protein [Anaerolineae bacterium]|nr:LysM peptidoglycan-binding domain-containing protein [Anaerolineae bacterium]
MRQVSRTYPVGIRLCVLCGVLLIALAACNLSAGDEESTPTPIPAWPTLTPTSGTITPIPPPLSPTPTGGALPDQDGIPPTQTNCFPQTGWPTYTVVEGDTLGQIAERTSSTVAQLVQANCLSNAELIYIGQALHVPVAPVTPTPTSTLTPAPTLTPTATEDPNMPVFQENLTADRHWIDSAGLAVTYADTVRVNAGEVLNANRVIFQVNDPAGGPAINIGSDDDPWDGAFVDYSFPAPGDYTFQAVAENESAQAFSTAFAIRYDPDFVPPEGQYNVLTITPFLQGSAGSYVLQGGATVMITWAAAPVGAERIDFTLTPTGIGTADLATTIGSDLNPLDGAMISWQVPQGLSGHVQGVATMPDGDVITSELMLVSTGS